MPKFDFMRWDWKEQLDSEILNKLLTEINEPVRCAYADTQADYYTLVIFTPDLDVPEINDKWEEIFGMLREDGDLSDKLLKSENYYQVESAEELLNYLKLSEVKQKLDRE